MRPGADIAAAFVLAIGAHAGLAAWLTGGDGRFGTGIDPTPAAAVIAGEAANALAESWRRPPDVRPDSPALARGPSAEAAPTIEAARDSAPVRRAPKAPESERGEISLPDRPEPLALPAPTLAAPQALAAPAVPPAVHSLPRADGPRPARASAAPIAATPNADRPPAPGEPAAPPPRVAEAGADTPRPKPRPETTRNAAATPAQQASSAPTGTGERSADKVRSQALKSAWAEAIGAKIARAQRHPGRRHGDGRVRLTLVVARDGRLADARIATSSGSSVLDRAALEAVRRASPFPRAPAEVADDWMRFGQWVSFRAR